MDIFVYGISDSGIRLKGITDIVEILCWMRRFYSSDEFELLLPANDKNMGLFTQDSIVELPGRYSGIITKTEIFSRDSSYYIKAKGCSFDGMFRRRVLIDFSEGDSLMTTVYRNCGKAAGEIRSFPETEFDFSCDCQSSLMEAYKFRSLAAFVNASCKNAEFGIMSELAHEGGRHYIKFYGRRAVDRSAAQNENRSVIFSDRYENCNDAEYVYSESGAMTGAVVYSESKYLYDSYIDEWHGIYGEDSRGFGRYEKAFRIQPKISYVPRTLGGQTVYVPALDKEATADYGGYIHLSNYSGFDERMRVHAVLKKDYREHFDVGDRITVECSKFGKLMSRSICEITERYTAEGFTAEVEAG